MIVILSNIDLPQTNPIFSLEIIRGNKKLVILAITLDKTLYIVLHYEMGL